MKVCPGGIKIQAGALDQRIRATSEGSDSLWELNFGGGARKCIGRNISCKYLVILQEWC